MESVVIAGMFCGTLILLTFIVLSSFPESRLRSVAMEFGKWMIAMFCLALVLSPIDILPDVIPIVGWGDDIGYPQVKAVRLGNPDEIIDDLPGLDAEFDYVVADGPGSQNETSRALLMRADMAIVPAKASMLEVRALSIATKALRHAQDVRKGVPPGVIVLSMIGKTHRLTQDMKDAAHALQLPLASTALTLRQAYADAPGQGTVVWKMGARASKAAKEIQYLFRELVPDAVRPKGKPKTK